MKMEAAITAPKAGKVSRIAVSATAQGRRWRPAGGGQLTRNRRRRVRPVGDRCRAPELGDHRSVREIAVQCARIGIDFAGASVLDLYAGSGHWALRRCRGAAASAVFVESDHRAAAVIDQNIASLGVTASVRRAPVAWCWLVALTARGLVFADPPYEVADTTSRRCSPHWSTADGRSHAHWWLSSARRRDRR